MGTLMATATMLLMAKIKMATSLAFKAIILVTVLMQAHMAIQIEKGTAVVKEDSAARDIDMGEGEGREREIEREGCENADFLTIEK